MTTENQTVITTQSEDVYIEQPSFKRWLKHAFYFKSSRRFFTAEQAEAITIAIEQAEDGHRGEIQVIVEANLPSHIAYRYDSKARAQALFAKYRVWDTERNSGVLIYLNLCEHQIELVADRGINQAVDTTRWDQIVQLMTPYFKQNNFAEGLCIGITELGEILEQFYANDPHDPEGNELPNTPRFL